jgi:phosphotriesterase-related protein
MEKINTVLGPISTDDLGLTLVHEHFAVAYSGWECDPLSRPYQKEKMVQMSLRAFEPVKAYGLQSIIDATPLDLNRDVDILKEISERLQLHIVCSTGRYTEEMGRWAYLRLRSQNKIGDIVTELYEGLLQEITQGIGPTGVKPGVIKVATGHQAISPIEEAVLRAGAKAAKETGLPIITHTEGGTMGPEQARFLIQEGADPKRIMIGHMCGNSSLPYQMSVLSQGVNIGFDRFGIELFVPDQVRMATLIGLLGIGYVERIMLSQDFIGCTSGRGGKMPDEARQKVANWSPSHIFRNILPALKQGGITDEQIRKMMVDNPKNFFS